MMNGKNLPILGIGNDIIEIERIRTSLAEHRERMLSRLFTQKEKDYCLKHKDPIPRFAGRFCAKEAVVKALGTGIGKEVSWLDIEILNDQTGKPLVYFSEKLKLKFPNTEVLISISHCELYVSSVALFISTP